MCSIQELPELKAKILEKVKLSAQDADISEVSKWSKAAEQCEKFIKESEVLINRVKNFKDSLWQSPDIIEQPLTSTPKIRTSPRKEGEEIRLEWVSKLSSKGIPLNGHKKRYFTSSSQSVGIAYANELQRPNNPNLIDKWFLGLKDEPTDIVVLLCKDLQGRLHDFILPPVEIKSIWKILSRGGGQVKFHVRRRRGEFLLEIPGKEPVSISKYHGKYQILK